jgi:hypothetical protein
MMAQSSQGYLICGRGKVASSQVAISPTPNRTSFLNVRFREKIEKDADTLPCHNENMKGFILQMLILKNN